MDDWDEAREYFVVAFREFEGDDTLIAEACASVLGYLVNEKELDEDECYNALEDVCVDFGVDPMLLNEVAYYAS